MKIDLEEIKQKGNTFLYVNGLEFAYVNENKKGLWDIWIEITTRTGFPRDESDFATDREAIKRAKLLARKFILKLTKYDNIFS